MAKILVEDAITQTDSSRRTRSKESNSKDARPGFQTNKFMQGKPTTWLVLSLILVVVLLLLTIIILLQRNASMTPLKVSPADPKEDFLPVVQTNSTSTKKLDLISRLDWLAQPAVEQPNPLSTPVPYVIILHSGTENCSSQAQCIFYVRFIQSFHIESRNWWDIGYNFLVGGDGEAYEGRGWKGEGAHTYGYNAKSIGIAFIGTFNSFKPPQRQITACKQLIQKGVDLGYIKKNYKVLAARQLQTTQSPGAALYEDMKTWDHWAPAP